MAASFARLSNWERNEEMFSFSVQRRGMTAESVPICMLTFSAHQQKFIKNLLLPTPVLLQFLIHYIHNILHWFVSNLYILSNSPCKVEGKNSLFFMKTACITI